MLEVRSKQADVPGGHGRERWSQRLPSGCCPLRPQMPVLPAQLSGWKVFLPSGRPSQGAPDSRESVGAQLNFHENKEKRLSPRTHISVWALTRGCLHQAGEPRQGSHAEAGVCLVPDPTGKGVLNHTCDYSVQGSLSYGSPPAAGRPSPGVQPVPPAPESGPRPPHSGLQGPCRSRRSVPHEISRQCPRWPGACGLCPGPGVPPRFPGGPRPGQSPGAMLSPSPFLLPPGFAYQLRRETGVSLGAGTPAELVPSLSQKPSSGHSEQPSLQLPGQLASPE